MSNANTTSAALLQTWDPEIVAEIRSSGVGLMHSAEDILGLIDVLLEPSAVAHTNLLLRLVGLCGDLVKLRTMAEFSGRVAEAQRLTNLCGCLERTIDADMNDSNVVGGRSRKRLVSL